MGNKKITDWLAIEGEYRAGVDSVNAIAAKYGVSEGAIRARAKKYGWTRAPARTKRAIVSARMAGIAKDVTNDVVRKINEAADENVRDMECGLRINRLCLVNLEAAAEAATEPKEIKIIVDAAAAALDSIRKICELDSGGESRKRNLGDLSDEELDAQIAAELEKYRDET